MEPFLNTITSFPAVPLTVVLGVVLGYWIFSLVTGAAFDASDAATGGVKGAAEAVKGLGGHHGVPGAHGVAAHHHQDAGEFAESGVLSLLGLSNIPVTITLSTAALVSWLACVLAMIWIAPGGLVLQSLILAASLVVGLLGTAVLLRPLGKALSQSRPARCRDSLGQICTITSGKVDASFGTAHVADGAAGLNVHVVCAKPNTLKKGDRAILIDFDAAKDTYEIEPVDWLLPQEIEALNDPTRAAQIISGRVRRR